MKFLVANSCQKISLQTKSDLLLGCVFQKRLIYGYNLEFYRSDSKIQIQIQKLKIICSLYDK